MRMLEEKKASTKSDSAVEIFDKVTDSQELVISDRREFSQHALKRWVRGTIEALRSCLVVNFRSSLSEANLQILCDRPFYKLLIYCYNC